MFRSHFWPRAEDKTVHIILFSGLVIQLISAINAVGYWHPDQQHSIIEFATYKMGITPLELMAWELPAQGRQTLQVYVFLGFYKVMQFLHLDEAYTAHTILRVIISLLNFTLFNYIILRIFEKDRRITLYTLLLVANFSWMLPYVKTLFNAEIVGGLTYFSAILLYKYFSARSMTTWNATLVGFVLSLAFFFRFQMGFAMIGLGIWLLFFEKASSRTIAAMAMGFLFGTAFNVFLDSQFYGEFAFTPYNYWKLQIIDGRVMGRVQSIWNFIGLLAVVFTAPPLSIILVLFLGRGFYKKFDDPYSLSAIFFLLVHFMVPHKEPRFLFPLFGILPVILGYGVRDYLNELPEKIKKKDFGGGVKSVVFASALVNIVLLVILLFVPVAQHIKFTETLNDYFDEDAPIKVFFYQRTPYETPSAQNVATYYLHSKKPNIEMVTIEDRSEMLERMNAPEKGTYFVSTYDRLVNDDLLVAMDSMNCETLTVSSNFLVRVNAWLQELKGPVLPELWALYACGR